jgi:hypothetical protein
MPSNMSYFSSRALRSYLSTFDLENLFVDFFYSCQISKLYSVPALQIYHLLRYLLVVLNIGSTSTPVHLHNGFRLYLLPGPTYW